MARPTGSAAVAAGMDDVLVKPMRPEPGSPGAAAVIRGRLRRRADASGRRRGAWTSRPWWRGSAGNRELFVDIGRLFVEHSAEMIDAALRRGRPVPRHHGDRHVGACAEGIRSAVHAGRPVRFDGGRHGRAISGRPPRRRLRARPAARPRGGRALRGAARCACPPTNWSRLHDQPHRQLGPPGSRDADPADGWRLRALPQPQRLRSGRAAVGRRPRGGAEGRRAGRGTPGLRVARGGRAAGVPVAQQAETDADLFRHALDVVTLVCLTNCRTPTAAAMRSSLTCWPRSRSASSTTAGRTCPWPERR